MSNQDPVDPRSAGSSGVCAPGASGDDDGAAAPAMAEVLGRLLERSGLAVPTGQVEAAARLLAPAVLSLGEVRELLPDGAWDGLVHRRCQMREADAEATAAPAEAAVEVLARRGGWELLRARSTHATPGGAQVLVEHDLARPLDGRDGRAVRRAPSASGVGVAKVDESASAGEDEPGLSDVRCLAQPAEAQPFVVSSAVARSTAVPRVRALRVTADDVAAWAQATGDRNAIHLEPGRAQALGLPAGGGQVVAHGLLLVALSLALRPPTSSNLDLRFMRSLPVDVNGTPVQVGLVGEVLSGGRVLLRRRLV